MDHTVNVNGACKCDVGFEMTVYDACQQCRRDTYRSDLNSLLCAPCGDLMVTEYAGSTNASDCHCNVGFTLVNGNECVCGAGFYRESTASSCWPCPRGTYKNTTGVYDSCVPCAYNMDTAYSGCTSYSNCSCKIGTYKSNAQCNECPVGAYCRGGDHVPTSLPGYFPSKSSSEIFIKCQNPEACVGGDGCADGYEGNQ